MFSRLAVVVLILFLSVSVGVPGYIIGRSLGFPAPATQFFYALGKYFGLLGFFVLLLQYLWTAKVRVAERFMSFDRRVSFHRTFGFAGFLLISLHPILILGSYAVMDFPLVFGFPLIAGFIAFLMLIVIVGSTFLGRLWGTPYETWKGIHWVTFAVVTFAFLHSVLLGSDMYGWFRILWISLYGLHVLVMVLKVIHKGRKRSRSYSVREVRGETSQVTTLVMDKPQGRHVPGQFGFISLEFGGKWSIWHPFSMTSLADEENLTMTIKGLGDFTNRIPDVTAGQKIKIDTAYGAFTPERMRDSRYVMIAGGIGITPIYCIMKALQKRDRPPDLAFLYTAHHEADIPFRGQIDSWFDRIPNWTHHYIMSSQPDWPGEKGRLIPDMMERLVEGDLSGTYFLCGPMGLINSMTRHLRLRGIPKSRIRREEFVFIP